MDNSIQDDTSSTGAKEEDDEDEEDDEKLDGLTCGDPEKLKAFNVSLKIVMKNSQSRGLKCYFDPLTRVWQKWQRMGCSTSGRENVNNPSLYGPLFQFQMFVRLFVDENLDRHVPISKQPKEKIQAIIDSCTRQFPEFAHRARKRIRTYLKSCRRTKRSREQAGLDALNVSIFPETQSIIFHGERT